MNSIQEELRKPAHYLSMRKREQAANYIDKLLSELNAALTAAQPVLTASAAPDSHVRNCIIVSSKADSSSGKYLFVQRGDVVTAHLDGYEIRPIHAQPAALPVTLTDEQIDNLACSAGLLDCLQDPYDKDRNGDNYGSVKYDIRRVARVVEEFHGIKALEAK